MLSEGSMPMEQNYKFTIAYDGSRFFGWERQPDRALPPAG